MIISKDSLFYHTSFKYSCLKNCIYNILRYYNLLNPMGYINCSIDLNLIYTEDSRFGIDIFYDCDKFPMYKKYMNKVTTGYGEDEKDIWDKNRKTIEKGIPIIIDTDVYYLPYRKEYKRYHGSHGIIINGYNKANVNIIDWYEPYFFYGDISYDDLSKSRSSINEYDNNPFSGRKINNYYIIINNKFKPLELETSLCDWISTSLDGNYDPKPIRNEESIREIKKVLLSNEGSKNLYSFLHSFLLGAVVSRKISISFLDYQLNNKYGDYIKKIQLNIKKSVHEFEFFRNILMRLIISFSKTHLEKLYEKLGNVYMLENLISEDLIKLKSLILKNK